jgi:formate hydrogenlyase transcriptional activator
LAHGGSLFLDEIGDISLELRPKLLRAVQEQEFERLGSSRTIHVNVRLIAATHRDLGAMIREEKFREDLFYRFNVFPIEIPPLRERREDIPLLVNHFVSKLSKRITSIPRQAMELLTNCPWKGNVRELANFLERAVILTHGEQLDVPTAELRPSCSIGVAGSSTSSFRQAECNVIIDALRAASGRIAGKGGAAERLGLKRTTLQNKIRRLGSALQGYTIKARRLHFGDLSTALNCKCHRKHMVDRSGWLKSKKSLLSLSLSLSLLTFRRLRLEADIRCPVDETDTLSGFKSVAV